jgi:hypothetical protein
MAVTGAVVVTAAVVLLALVVLLVELPVIIGSRLVRTPMLSAGHSTS